MAPQNTDGMVVFLMPDGSKVSNDPGFDQAKAMEEMLASKPNTGDIGVPHDEQVAQTQVERVASLQSGQPGVGDNATVDDPTKDLHGVLGSPAQQRQVEDAKAAKEAGASPASTSVDDPEPVDSNKAVLEVREARAKAQERLQKASDGLGEDGPGDPEKPFSEWSAAQLKHEVALRNAQEDRAEEHKIELKRGMKKPDVAALLDADNERIAGQQA